MSNQKNKLSNNHVKDISRLMLEKKALDIKIIDVRKITTLTDFLIICTSESQPQTRAITDHIQATMKKKKLHPLHLEGYENLNWVLMDYVHFVVHVFSPESRDYYDLERLWADGNITSVIDKK